MKLCELNPHIRYAVMHKSTFKARRELSICYDARLFYFEDIDGSITVNGEKHWIANKTAIYLPPLSRYIFNVRSAENSAVYVVNFDLTAEYEHLKLSLGTATVSDFDENRSPKYELSEEFSKPLIKPLPSAAPLVANCLSTYLRDGNLHAERASAVLKLALLEIIDRENTVRSPICESVISCVEKNYADTSLTNESIALMLNYHPYYLNRVVKRELGVPLRTYVINYRLSVAKELLVSSDYNISEIAFRTGFSTSAYFVKMFKDKNGITPKEYRRQRINFEFLG